MSDFIFTGCVEIRELLGKKADDERRLLEILEEVSLDSVYYHTHSYFLRHFYIAGVYPNDFATWAVAQVRDRVLGEKLAEVTPFGDKGLEEIRAELIEIIDGHLSSISVVPGVVYGQPFYFMQSRIIEVPTGISVNDIDDFLNALQTVDASAIYNHLFEARLRDRQGRSDFAIWMEQSLGLRHLAERIEKIDSYMYSLEGLRKKLLRVCRQELGYDR